MLAENQIAINSSWDWDRVNLEIGELKNEGVDLNLLGLSSLIVDQKEWDFEGSDISDVKENLDGIISTIKVKCPQDQKEELVLFLKGKILEASFEGVEVV